MNKHIGSDFDDFLKQEKIVNKPEKKDVMKFAPLDNYPVGFNQACEEWEPYHKEKIEEFKKVPTPEQIEQMLEDNWNQLFSPEENYLGRYKLACAISEFIRGE